jgi:hypothetical protein
VCACVYVCVSVSVCACVCVCVPCTQVSPCVCDALRGPSRRAGIHVQAQSHRMHLHTHALHCTARRAVRARLTGPSPTEKRRHAGKAGGGGQARGNGQEAKNARGVHHVVHHRGRAHLARGGGGEGRRGGEAAAGDKGSAKDRDLDPRECRDAQRALACGCVRGLRSGGGGTGRPEVKHRRHGEKSARQTHTWIMSRLARLANKRTQSRLTRLGRRCGPQPQASKSTAGETQLAGEGGANWVPAKTTRLTHSATRHKGRSHAAHAPSTVPTHELYRAHKHHHGLQDGPHHPRGTRGLGQPAASRSLATHKAAARKVCWGPACV